MTAVPTTVSGLASCQTPPRHPLATGTALPYPVDRWCGPDCLEGGS